MLRTPVALLTTLIISMTIGVGGCGGGGSGSNAPSEGTIAVGLTDAPIDDLQSLVLDVTAIRLTQSGGANITILAPAAPIAVDVPALLNRNLLASVTAAPPGSYIGAEIDFSAATAVHTDGNARTVNPANGTITITFEETVAILAGASSGLVIDLDGDQLVTSVDATTANLSLLLNDVEVKDGAVELDDFEGTVFATAALTFSMRVEDDGQVLGILVVEVPGGITVPTVGDEVEVDGTFQANGILLASRVEIESSNNDPDQIEGVVVVVNAGVATIQLIEVEKGTSPTVASGQVSVDISGATVSRDNGGAIPVGSPFPGQRIEASGNVNGGGTLVANEVELRETHIEGTVTTTTPFEIAITRIERFDATLIAGLPTSTQVTNAAANGFNATAAIEIEGVFLEAGTPPQFEADEVEIEAELEDGTNGVVVGDPATSDTFTADFTGRTGFRVQIQAGARLTVEDDSADTETPISLADLMALIDGGTVTEVEVEGTFSDPATGHDFEADEVEIEIP